MSYISAYCKITNEGCSVNGNQQLVPDNESFLKKIYTSLDPKYPKFHKMDDLSKLGFLAVELLKKEMPQIEDYADDGIALLLANSTSSSQTDLEFDESYQVKNAPSPSLFVYTLPNIIIGEICIRNKWYGESMFTIAPEFDPKYFVDYTTILLNTGAEACLGGWIDATKDEFEAFLFFVTKTDLKQLNLPFDEQNLAQINK